MQGQISFGKSQILLRDYTRREEIKAVLLEICEVARSARTHNKVGRTISQELDTVKMSLVVDFIEQKQLIFLQISQWIFIDAA